MATCAARPHVLLVGAGVISLTTAVRILDTIPEARLTITCRERIGSESEGCVSFIAGGLVMPHEIAGTAPARTDRWTLRSVREWERVDRKREFVRRVRAKFSPGMSDFDDNLALFRELEFAAVDVAARELTTVRVDPRGAIAWLIEQLVAGGKYSDRVCVRDCNSGLRDRSDVERLARSLGASVVVVAAGLGSRALAHDDSMYAVKGQIARISSTFGSLPADADRATSVELTGDGKLRYLIPLAGADTVLGGTGIEHDESTSIDPVVHREILRHFEGDPRIGVVTAVRALAGSRPCRRGGVRVESESSSDSQGVHFVYNYGHGGSGWSIAWGCADDAAELVREALSGDEKRMPSPRL